MPTPLPYHRSRLTHEHLARPFAFATALAACASARAARADETKTATYGLGWTRLEGAEPCVGSRELADGVERALGRRAFTSPSQANKTIEGRVAPQPGGGFRAAVHLSEANGTLLGSRELATEGPDCRALDEPLTLSVALLIDPSAKGPAPPAETPAAPAGRGAPQGPPPTTDATRLGRFEMSALAGYVFGDQAFLVKAAFADGLGLGAGLRLGYAFRSGAWVGASYMHFNGGDYGGLSWDGQSITGNYYVNVLGGEVGYRLPLWRLEIRPYVGIGLAAYGFNTQYRSAPDNRIQNVTTRLTNHAPADSELDNRPPSPHTSLAVWPGVSVSLPFNDVFFVGADARWMLISDATAQRNVGLFANVGVRF